MPKVAVRITGASADNSQSANLDTTITYREGTPDEVIDARAVKKFNTFMRRTDKDVLAALTSFVVTRV